MLESPWGVYVSVSCVDTLSQIFSTADRSLGFLAGKFSKIFARCARRQIFIQIFENLGLPQQTGSCARPAFAMRRWRRRRRPPPHSLRDSSYGCLLRESDSRECGRLFADFLRSASDLRA